MHTELRFKNLPFSPVQSQVIYIENEYSDVANEFIRTYTRELTGMFAMRGLEFIYFPHLYQDPSLEEKVRYYAPYLQSEITYEELPQSSLLLDCMTSPEDRQAIRPCFIIYGYTDKKEKVFHCWKIDTEAEDLKMDFNRILHEIEDYKDFPGLSHNPNTKPRTLSSIVDCSESRTSIPEEPVRCCEMSEKPKRMIIPDEPVRCCEMSEKPKKRESIRERISRMLSPTPSRSVDRSHGASFANKVCEYEDFEDCYNNPDPIEEILSDLQRTVKRLQLKGITLAAIHELIDKQEKLSRLVITSDYRIFLPDYNNVEIEMSILPKAVFFFFLRYPEGIVIKTLPDHLNEIKRIYQELRPNVKEEALQLRMTELTNPTNNKIHENIARIRHAFMQKFDEHLAKNYFITGIPGEEYRIPLDRQLEEWTDQTAEEWLNENK